jgi:hypothetical protein
LTAPRPDPTLSNIYEYESSGVSNQNQMIISFRANPSPKYSIFGNYRLGFAKSDTDGGFPAYSYDFAGEYGRSGGDIRHNFLFGGNINLPWQISASPFIQASTGRPFNIVTGVDSNGDLQFTERPTFGALADRCSQLSLTNSFCDVSGKDPNAIIPRNYGQAPAYFSVNLRLSKNFGFGGKKETSSANGQGGNGRQGGGGGRGGRGGGGGGGGFPGGGGRGGGGGAVMVGGPGGGFGGGDSRKPYNLNVGINFNNLFNNVNFNAPVGNMQSARFGQSTQTYAGFGGFGAFGGGGGTANRTIQLQMRFSW